MLAGCPHPCPGLPSPCRAAGSTGGWVRLLPAPPSETRRELGGPLAWSPLPILPPADPAARGRVVSPFAWVPRVPRACLWSAGSTEEGLCSRPPNSQRGPRPGLCACVPSASGPGGAPLRRLTWAWPQPLGLLDSPLPTSVSLPEASPLTFLFCAAFC